MPDAPCRLHSFNIGQRGLQKTLDMVSSGSLASLIDQLGSDVLCLQETKTPISGLTERTALVSGFNSFFLAHKGGAPYAGVATIVRNTLPILSVEEGLTGSLSRDRAAPEFSSQHHPPVEAPPRAGMDTMSPDALSIETSRTYSALELDMEGRALIVELGLASADPCRTMHRLVIINTYCPALASEDRAAYKWQFHEMLQRKAFSYYAKYSVGVTVIVTGDLNVAHTQLDHADWDGWEKRHHGRPYSTGVFRRWMDGMLQGVVVSSRGEMGVELAPRIQGCCMRFADAFRCRHPSRRGAFTCWNTVTSARATNFGTRLDYFLIDDGVCTLQHAADADIGSASAGVDAAGGSSLRWCACSASIRLLDSDVLQHVQGSDHCPVLLHLLIRLPSSVQHAESTSSSTQATAHHPQSVNAHPDFRKRQAMLTSFLLPSRQPMASSNGSGKRSNSVGESAMKPLYGAGSGVTSDSFEGREPSRGSSQTVAVETGVLAPNRSLGKRKGVAEATTLNSWLKRSAPSVTGGADGGEVLVIDDDEEDADVPLPLHLPEPEGPSNIAQASASAWAGLFVAPPPPPTCACGIPMVFRTVLKNGANKGRSFYTCARPEGRKGSAGSRCDAFEWMDFYRKRMMSGVE